MLQNSLTAIWTDLLGFEQVGIHDNFFDLGGHSLLATRVLARIHKEFRVEMPLSRFFETPTVAALADYIDRIGPSRDRTETFPIGTAEGAGNAPVSFAQQRLWFLDQLEPENSAYNLFTAFQLTGRLDVTALEQSFNEIIRRHQVLRTVFKSIDGQPCQIVLPSLQIKIPLVDLKDLASDKDRESGLRDLFRTEAHQPFDLARGPLLRVTLVELAEHRHVLLTAFHHIVFDGWSMGILARELSSLYEVFCAGRTSPLPELLTQYADFARWTEILFTFSISFSGAQEPKPAARRDPFHDASRRVPNVTPPLHGSG
jgi:acyl carrier protein